MCDVCSCENCAKLIRDLQKRCKSLESFQSAIYENQNDVTICECDICGDYDNDDNIDACGICNKSICKNCFKGVSGLLANHPPCGFGYCIVGWESFCDVCLKSSEGKFFLENEELLGCKCVASYLRENKIGEYDL